MAVTTRTHDEAHHDHPYGWRRFLYSTNHKDIGTMYIVFALFGGLVGGVLYLAQGVAAAFGSGWGPLMVPLALQEIVLAIWLIIKGFTEHIVADADREPEPQLSR